MFARPENYLLQQMPDAAFQLLRPHLTTITLEAGETLYEAEDEIERVIFPETGLLAVVSSMISGATVETSMVGRNGAVGFVEAYGTGRLFSRVTVQSAGRALTAPASRYRQLVDESRPFRVAIATHVELILAEGRRDHACAVIHRADSRLARWLLDCIDLANVGPSLPLTQEFLCGMLGVQRTTVSSLLGGFEQEGMVRQFRGRIEVTDPAALEARACECRAVIDGLRRAIQPGTNDRLKAH